MIAFRSFRDTDWQNMSTTTRRNGSEPKTRAVVKYCIMVIATSLIPSGLTEHIGKCPKFAAIVQVQVLVPVQVLANLIIQAIQKAPVRTVVQVVKQCRVATE